MIAEQIVDILNLYNAVRFELVDPALKEERLKRFWEETLPYYVGLFENLFETQKTMFVAADQITWADFAFACFFDLIGKEKRDHLFEKVERCKTIFNKVEAEPGISQWKKSRPVTEL
jgi:glutathione S-transferase